MYITEDGRTYNLKSAICKKGHLQISTLQPEQKCSTDFCQECGSEIIDCCPHCNFMIIGGIAKEKYVLSNLITGERDRRITFYKKDYVPSYCPHCGKPYPWVENFLKEYKEILEFQLEESEKELRDKIYTATEEFIKSNCDIKSVAAQKLKVFFTKVSTLSREIFVNSLVSYGTDQIKDFFL